MAGGTAPSLRHASAPRALGLAAALLLGATACAGPPAAVRLTIPRGATLAQVADSLAARGAIPNRLAFRLLARRAGVDRRVVPGLYEVPARATMPQIVRLLGSGNVIATRFTLREGLTLYEVAALASERLGLSADSVIAAATDRAAASRIMAGAPSFEGLLFPDTYQVAGDVTPTQLVALLAAQFLAVWDTAWDARATALGLSRLQVLTLASLVEGEARVEEERPIIAGVYYNRWKIGMALQADPTVQYALVQRDGGRKPRLYLKDYGVASPYNTYLHPGFPPGPVNSPGRASILAALAPAKVPFRFFVAGPDGRHRFATSFDEHRRNVVAMRSAWEAARRQP